MRQEKVRNIQLDILRIAACMLVILSHTSSDNIDTLSVASGVWKVEHLYNSLGHTGTILFLFISGALLLRESYRFEPKKFYRRNFLRVLTAYVFWIVVYHMVGLRIRGDYSPAALKDVAVEILRGNASYHFWYLPMLLGVYLLLPMLRAICRSGRKLVVYFTALFLIVQVGFTTVLFLDFPHKYIWESMMTRIPFTMINHYIGYFVMGYLISLWLQENKIKKPILWGGMLIVAGAALGLLGDLAVTAQTGSNSIQFNTLFSATLCMSAAGFYITGGSLRITLPGGLARVVNRTAELTFGIYLIHPLVLSFVKKYLFTIEAFHPILSIPAITVVVFLLSEAAIWVLSKAPILKKWAI